MFVLTLTSTLHR